jgi:hypothetical protein
MTQRELETKIATLADQTFGSDGYAGVRVLAREDWGQGGDSHLVVTILRKSDTLLGAELTGRFRGRLSDLLRELGLAHTLPLISYPTAHEYWEMRPDAA